jgi:hypothetical protein
MHALAGAACLQDVLCACAYDGFDFIEVLCNNIKYNLIFCYLTSTQNIQQERMRPRKEKNQSDHS